MDKKKAVIMDGNEAAAYVSYAFTEVAGIFPITPSSPMAEHVDEWAANGKKKLFGQPVQVAVSYTHLDVYKRQLQIRKARCGQAEIHPI